jgi:hypothetical protein
MAKLKKIECLGGPLDGKRVAVSNEVDFVTTNLNPLVTHWYTRDEQQLGKRVRQVFRHYEIHVDDRKK